MNTDTRLLDISRRVANIVATAMEISVEDAEELAATARRHVERLETMGPILDPTAYLTDINGTRKSAEVIIAFLELRRTIERCRAK